MQTQPQRANCFNDNLKIGTISIRKALSTEIDGSTENINA
jgi:hypothetical protein